MSIPSRSQIQLSEGLCLGYGRVFFERLESSLDMAATVIMSEFETPLLLFVLIVFGLSLSVL